MDFNDCSLKVNGDVFRLRACGILIKEDMVLVVGNDQSPYYYSLGGAVHVGESTAEAAIREVYEETGHVFEIDRLLFIHENFFHWKEEGQFKDHSFHELAFYYLMKWDPGISAMTPGVTIFSEPEKLHWFKITELDKADLPVYPTFFAKELLHLSDTIKHIVTYE